MLSLDYSTIENLPNGVLELHNPLLGVSCSKEFMISTTVSTAFDTNVNPPRGERVQTDERGEGHRLRRV